MKLGIVGLPNVGKSTLFNALTNAGAQAANYAFCTIEPNIGVVAVPDSRLDFLAKMYIAYKESAETLYWLDLLYESGYITKQQAADAKATEVAENTVAATETENAETLVICAKTEEEISEEEVIEEGDIQFTTGPQQKQIVTIPYKKPNIVPGKEYRIMVTSTLKEKQVWADAGHQVAWDQLELTEWNLPAVPEKLSASNLNAEENDKLIKISGNGFCYIINNIYYDITNTITYDALYYFIIGERGVGKTYSAKKFCIRRFLKTGEQFVYLRRYKTDLEKGKKKFFKALINEGKLVLENNQLFIIEIG